MDELGALGPEPSDADLAGPADEEVGEPPTVGELFAYMESQDTEEREDAISLLAELVCGAFGDDGAMLGHEVRAAGGVPILARLLEDPSATVPPQLSFDSTRGSGSAPCAPAARRRRRRASRRRSPRSSARPPPGAAAGPCLPTAAADAPLSRSAGKLMRFEASGRRRKTQAVGPLGEPVDATL